VFNVIVPWGETLIGLGLILGCLTTTAMFFGLIMNFSFFLAGTVSHNPRDIFLGFIILTAGCNAGRIGLDRWVVPFITKWAKKVLATKKQKQVHKQIFNTKDDSDFRIVFCALGNASRYN
jgi:thiosulfate dehydrogenase [quinone] large subunit